MTLYVTWLKTEDVAFRAAYLDETGEAVEDYPRENATRYLLGSSIVTEADCAALDAVFDITYSSTEPSGYNYQDLS